MNVRRHFMYLEHSIEAGTQWAVFEPKLELTGDESDAAT